MKNIALIHFLPLEYYPPATNMINYLAEELDKNIKLFVFTTHNTKNRNVFNNNKTKIYRTPQSEDDKNKLIRLLKYIYFQLFVLLKLIIIRPKKILYYESLSSFPVYLYSAFINPKVKIYIHYHEYTTLMQYETQSMAIERFFHKLEQKYIYKRAVWISHTNKDRLNMFFADNQNIKKSILIEMPNYPPKSWKKKIKKTEIQDIKQLKCVYIGALSFNDTYIKNFIKWVIAQNGNVVFDIFSYNLHLETLNYLKNIKSKYINFHSKGIEYNELPLVLPKYNVGIILYKGKTKNFEFNAPNKLFEYLICGLDVWFPNIMKGIMPYANKTGTPQIIPVNFEKLYVFDYKKEITKVNNTEEFSNYFCESVFKRLKIEFEI